MLIVMAGLPAAGKSTIAEDLGRVIGAPVVSVDPIEAAMWKAGIAREQPTGLAAYVVAETMASEILALGQRVIIDAVNDAEPARKQWRNLAATHRVALRIIEVICSDPDLHRQRLEQRRRNLHGFPEPDWPAVQHRAAAFASWTEDRLTLDSVSSPAHNLRAATHYLEIGSNESDR